MTALERCFALLLAGSLLSCGAPAPLPESDVLGALEDMPPAIQDLPGRPDRVAFSPDGAWIAYVSGATGIASMWVVPASGGAPTQLTNVGLEAATHLPGRPPEGFVPVPHRDPPRFDGDFLVWRSSEGEQRVRWR